MSVLREGLLDGRAIAVAGGRAGRCTLRWSGSARAIEDVPADAGLGEDEEQVGDWARSKGRSTRSSTTRVRGLGPGGEAAL